MIMKKDKYYDKLCENGLKKRFKSIPVEDRLPVGILEPDHTELSSGQDDASSTLLSNKQGNGVDASGHDDISSPLLSNKECDYVDEYHDCSISNVPHLFDPILMMPTEESLPSNADFSDSMYIERNNNAIIKARGERNEALLLAKHYRDIAEKYKLEKKILQIETERKIIDTKEQAAIGIDRIKKFWRSQIMEGNSRAGKILRAAQLQKYINK